MSQEASRPDSRLPRVSQARFQVRFQTSQGVPGPLLSPATKGGAWTTSQGAGRVVLAGATRTDTGGPGAGIAGRARWCTGGVPRVVYWATLPCPGIPCPSTTLSYYPALLPARCAVLYVLYAPGVHGPGCLRCRSGALSAPRAGPSDGII